MPWYSILMNALDRLGWPLVILVIAMVLRRDISALIARMKGFKVGGGKLRFAAEFGDTATTEVLKLQESVPMAVDADKTERVAVPGSSPLILMEQAYGEVQKTLTELALRFVERRQVELPSDPSAVAEVLSLYDEIPVGVANAINVLVSMWTSALNSPDELVDEISARKFIELADSVRSRLESAEQSFRTR